jgi:hypothetical protein
VYRYASGLTNGKEARHNPVRVLGRGRNHLSMIVGRNSPHIVMYRGQNGDGLLSDINACKYLGCFRYTGETLRQHRGRQMLQVEEDMVFILANPPTFVDLKGHGPTDHVS